MQYCKLID